MGIPPDGVDERGLGGTKDGASRGGRNIERRIERGGTECEGVEVVIWSMD